MKKLICCILSAVIVMSIAACTSKPTATPDNISVTSLSEYTIVYPSTYKDWQMTEVNLLRDVIEHLTGKKPNVIPDTQPEAAHEIIFASSKRKTSLDGKIAAFTGKMDYAVAVDGKNIVLGGQNYYSDMRAAYDFINNYLGYDDIEDKYSEPSKKIQGISENIWKEPEFYIMGSNFSCASFDKTWQIRDFVDCNFNLLHIQQNAYKSDEDVRNVATWCARFGIELFLYPNIDSDTKQVTIPCEDDLIENPAMWGLYIFDEPYTEEQNEFYSVVSNNAKERFDRYGWNICVNTVFSTANQNAPNEFDSETGEWLNESTIAWKKYYSDLSILSFDMYPYQSKFKWRERYVCLALEQSAGLAKECNQDLFIYIDAYDLVNRGYCDKMFRTHSYLLLSFGVKGIEYFQYGDASPFYDREGDWTKGSLVNWDYTKNKYWYDAQKVNAELKKLMPVYGRYENKGAYVINKKEGDNVTYMHNPYEDFGVIEDVDDSLAEATFGESPTYVVGCFEAKDGNGKAFTLVNMDELNDNSYGSDFSFPVRLKINGSKVTCYKNGEPTVMQPDADGYYSFSMPNGECVFVTVE